MDSLTGFGTLNYVVLFTYLSVMVGVGALFSGKQKTTEEYFLAGRRMPWLVVGMSMFASITSAISYMGIPGTAYRENISLLMMAFLAPIVAPILIFVFYPFYRVLNVTTSYEYVLQRYGQPARLTVSGLFVLARLGWLGAVIYAPSLALSIVTGMPLWLAILLMGILATTYTALGGLSAVLWTDLAQFLILVGGALGVALSLTASVPGGLASIWQIAQTADHVRVIDWQLSLTEMTGIAVVISYFFQLMHDYGTDQVTVQRLLSVKTFRGMAKATIFNAMAELFIVSLLLYVGLGLFAYFQTFPSELAAGITGDRVLPYYIMHALPQGVSGLLITGIFAAAMSSVDSGINSVATVSINDFVRPLRSRPRSEQHDVKLARFLTLLLGSFATVVALSTSQGWDRFSRLRLRFWVCLAGPSWPCFYWVCLPGVSTFAVGSSAWWSPSPRRFGFSEALTCTSSITSQSVLDSVRGSATSPVCS